LLAIALLTAFFFLLTALVLRADLQPTSWDIGITREIQRLPPLVDELLRYVSVVGFEPWNWVLSILLVAFMAFRRWFVEMAFTALAASGGLTAELVKNLVDRPRPSPEYATIYRELTSYSFPSGHVTGYVTLFGFVFYLAYTLLPRRSPTRWFILITTGLLILLVGPSRVSMGQHWASDTLAGYALGFAFLLLVIELHRLWLGRHPKRPVFEQGPVVSDQ
jgi:undecaprenyl-diphosphatase